MLLTFRFKRNYTNIKIKYKIIGIFVAYKKAAVLKSIIYFSAKSLHVAR